MNREIIDHTLPIHEGMQTFPTHWHPFVEITQLGRHGIENRETRKITLGTHTGTHMDAPRHFFADGATLDDIPLATLIGPACLVNFSHLADLTPVTVEMLIELLGQTVPERLILRFDWDRHIGTQRYYSHHPYLTPEAAHYLVDKGLILLAMDTPQPDNPAHGQKSLVDSPIHKIFLSKGVILVEYLCNLAPITQMERMLFVAPLKIAGGDGAPARCFSMDLEALS